MLALVSTEMHAYKYNKWVHFIELTNKYIIREPRFPGTT